MAEKITFTIEEDLLGAAGAMLPGEKSPISLLKGTGGQAMGDATARIRAAGILDGSGAIKQEYRHAFDTLAQTRCFARLKFSAGEKIFEFIVYFPTDTSPPVSLLHNGNRLVVEDPAGIDPAFALMDQHIGHSFLSSTTFNGEFSQTEALALFALIDLERKTLLHGLADSADPHNAPFNLATILDQVKNPKKNFQSLEFVLQSRIILNGLPAQDQIESGLKSLTGKGMVRQHSSGFSLNDALFEIASRFLIMDSFVVLESCRLDQNNIMWGGSFLSLQAGVNDVLYLEGHAEEVIVKCITAGELLGLMNTILSDPTFVALPAVTSSPGTPPSPESAPKRKFCPQCGAPLTENKKFCNKCGAKVS
ncbi:MAG: zinc ribbon domain-containing protein [Methanoregulaceae archaeon]|nr:MAG: zinc ribbon domain-containing protein [Methanoregulaceae archaeon]